MTRDLAALLVLCVVWTPGHLAAWALDLGPGRG